MADGIYAALSGAVAQSHAMEMVSNSLANVNTVGFKGDNITFKQVLSKANTNPSSATSVHVEMDQVIPDLRQGRIVPTQRPLDCAVDGPGFFVVSTPDGERLSRNGSFNVRPDGLLQDPLGNLVHGAQGLVVIPVNAKASIDQQGIVYADETVIERLKVVDITDPSKLRREAGGLWSTPEGTAVPIETRVQAGALEGSNVNSVQLMTRLIGIQRAYEAYHRSMETINGMEKKLAQEIR